MWYCGRLGSDDIFHTNAFNDFNQGQLQGEPSIDLLGLDLPRYGRAYVEHGYDIPGNEYNSVEPPASSSGHKWCEFYYGAYSGALKFWSRNLDTRRNFFYVQFNIRAHFPMFCGAYSGISCVPVRYTRNCGVVFTAPFGTRPSEASFLSVIPVSVSECLAYCFPKLIVDSDIEGHISWFDAILRNCARSLRGAGRTAKRVTAWPNKIRGTTQCIKPPTILNGLLWLHRHRGSLRAVPVQEKRTRLKVLHSLHCA